MILYFWPVDFHGQSMKYSTIWLLSMPSSILFLSTYKLIIDVTLSEQRLQKDLYKNILQKKSFLKWQSLVFSLRTWSDVVPQLSLCAPFHPLFSRSYCPPISDSTNACVTIRLQPDTAKTTWFTFKIFYSRGISTELFPQNKIGVMCMCSYAIRWIRVVGSAGLTGQYNNQHNNQDNSTSIQALTCHLV